jgi:hypothetical protein
MDDGTEFEAQALNIDMLTFDRQRARLGWPTASDAPFVWLTFLAWSAAMRESLIPELSLSEFEQRAWQVSNADDDEAGQTVDPTKPAAEDG